MSRFAPLSRRSFGAIAVGFVAPLIVAALAGCSSVGQLAGSPAPGDGAGSPEGQAGSGSLVIGVIAFDETGNLSDGAPDSVARAAELAATTLKGNPVTVLVRSASADGAALGRAIGDFDTAGVQMVIGTNSERDAAAVAKAQAARGVPTISLTSFSDLAILLYGAAYVPNEEAVALVDEAARRGYRSLAVVTTGAPPSQALARSVLSLAGAAGLDARIVDGATNSQFQAGASALAAAGVPLDAIVFASGPARAAEMLSTLKGDDRFKSVGIVGNSGWALAGKLPPALKGAWYTTVAGNGFADFAEKFRRATGATPTLNAAMVYDLVVLAAALPQAAGEEPYHPEIMTSESGFKGFTGAFRFGPGGMVAARSYVIATVK